jgi:hypothetical protein
MTNYLRDMTTGKKYIISMCHYCDAETYPTGKPIDPTDWRAVKTEKGDYKCGNCVVEDRVKMGIRTLGPEHPNVKYHIDEDRHNVDLWNDMADALNKENREKGGTRELMKRKKYKYW